MGAVFSPSASLGAVCGRDRHGVVLRDGVCAFVASTWAFLRASRGFSVSFVLASCRDGAATHLDHPVRPQFVDLRLQLGRHFRLLPQLLAVVIQALGSMIYNLHLAGFPVWPPAHAQHSRVLLVCLLMLLRVCWRQGAIPYSRRSQPGRAAGLRPLGVDAAKKSWRRALRIWRVPAGSDGPPASALHRLSWPPPLKLRAGSGASLGSLGGQPGHAGGGRAGVPPPLTAQSSDEAAGDGGRSGQFLEVAEGLRKTLENSPDFDLSAGQRQTLHAFMRAANAKAHHQGDAADFLQVQQQRTGQPAEYGDYESQGGGVVSTLESVLDKTKAQLDEARQEETRAADTAAKYEADLKAEIKNLKRTMSELNTQLSQSQESSGQMQSQLIAATELLKVSEDQLKEIEAEFSEKSRNYKDRVAKRSDELMALTEAKEILSSEAMSQALNAAAQAPEKASGVAPGADSFLQFSRRLPAACARGYRLARQAAELAARRWGQRAEEAAPALSLLALRSRSRAREADPFDKVKDMISSMLAKLQDQQNEEAKHKEWCDREMSKSVQSQKEKHDNIRKLTDRIAAMDAELAQVTDGINVVTEDLAEMSASIKSATELRTDEHNSAETAVTQSRD
ncbi:unnamed protein product, partial [Prorocentrum cordatum]